MRIEDHKNELIIAGWMLLSQFVMHLLEIRFGYEAARTLVLLLEEHIPTLRRMNHDALFNVQLAQAQAAVMICLIPILSVSFLWIDPQEILSTVRKKGRENTAVAIIFYASVLLLIFFLGLNSRGPSRVFEETSYGFAILSAFMTLPFGHYIRSIIAILFDK